MVSTGELDQLELAREVPWIQNTDKSLCALIASTQFLFSGKEFIQNKTARRCFRLSEKSTTGPEFLAALGKDKQTASFYSEITTSKDLDQQQWLDCAGVIHPLMRDEAWVSTFVAYDFRTNHKNNVQYLKGFVKELVDDVTYTVNDAIMLEVYSDLSEKPTKVQNGNVKRFLEVITKEMESKGFFLAAMILYNSNHFVTWTGFLLFDSDDETKERMRVDELTESKSNRFVPQWLMWKRKYPDEHGRNFVAEEHNSHMFDEYVQRMAPPKIKRKTAKSVAKGKTASAGPVQERRSTRLRERNLRNRVKEKGSSSRKSSSRRSRSHKSKSLQRGDCNGQGAMGRNSTSAAKAADVGQGRSSRVSSSRRSTSKSVSRKSMSRRSSSQMSKSARRKDSTRVRTKSNAKGKVLASAPVQERRSTRLKEKAECRVKMANNNDTDDSQQVQMTKKTKVDVNSHVYKIPAVLFPPNVENLDRSTLEPLKGTTDKDIFELNKESFLNSFSECTFCTKAGKVEKKCVISHIIVQLISTLTDQEVHLSWESIGSVRDWLDRKRKDEPPFDLVNQVYYQFVAGKKFPIASSISKREAAREEILFTKFCNDNPFNKTHLMIAMYYNSKTQEFLIEDGAWLVTHACTIDTGRWESYIKRPNISIFLKKNYK